jgi:hypothetical protein
MGNILNNICREKENTYFKFNNFFSENHAVCEIMSKNMEEVERPQMTIQYGACALHTG